MSLERFEQPVAAAYPQLRELSTTERRTLAACWAGWVLDGMDTQLYSFAIPAIMLDLAMTRSQAGTTGTIVLLMSAFGGWVAGYLSDRVGRVRTLQITILWFALLSFLSGLVQDANQLLLARGLMGLGFGGEYAAGAVLLSESIRAEWRGRALGVMGTGFAVGWGLAALLFALMFSLLEPSMAWRALFLIGVVPAFLVLFIRSKLHDPERYRNVKAASAGAKLGPFEIFKPEYVRATVLCALLASGAQGGYVTVMTWLPTYLDQERGFAVASTGIYVLVTVVGSFFGYLAGAYLSDALGRKPTFAVFGVGASAMLAIYGLVPSSDALLLVLGLPLGFFLSGSYSVMPALFSELFPTHVRGVGLGFVHNFGRGVGAFAPLLVGIFSERLGLGFSIGIFGAGGFAVMLLFAALLPETRGVLYEGIDWPRQQKRRLRSLERSGSARLPLEKLAPDRWPTSRVGIRRRRWRSQALSAFLSVSTPSSRQTTGSRTPSCEGLDEISQVWLVWGKAVALQ